MATSCVKAKNGKKGYLDDNGKWVTNSWLKIKGNWKYISSSSGFVTGWKTIGKYKYYFTKDGYLSQDLRNFYTGRSASRYKVEVNRITCTATVYTNETEGGEFNIPVVCFRVSVGNPITNTLLGTYKMTRADRWQILMGPSYGQYGTHVVNGIYFHSVASAEANDHNLSATEYNRLGTPASHGCIRMCVSDAKWIWENCNGSYVTIYDDASSAGPFDKPTLPLMNQGDVSDPTDPAIVGSSPSPHANPV
jgi:hypothetical protein